MSSTRTSNGTTPRAPRRQDKPAGVALNLDTLEREGGAAEPFVFVHDGKRRIFTDPYELDWQELATAITDPRILFRLALSEQDADDLLGAKIPAWKIDVLATKYLEYYGIDLGNLQASSGRG